LFSDEVYRGLEYDSGDRLPGAAALSPRAMSLGVMSKSYGLGGVRVGWIATRDAALRSRLMALKDYTTICNAAPSEILSLIALRARDRVVARSLAIVRENLRVAESFFGRHGDRLEWIPPRAGSTAFPRLRHESASAFAEALVREEGVLLLPGSHFGSDGGHFRLGLGRTDMPEAMNRMEQFMTRTPRVAPSAQRASAVAT
jgi:aspartate/methionine/tyrosine aminotransferase